MSKRNFVLLIIILAIITAIILGFFFFYQPKSQTTGDKEGDTNFFSDFFPFGRNKNASPDTMNPADVSGYIPPPETETPEVKLTKVSDAPVAGYGIFMKERFVDIAEIEEKTEENASAKENAKPVSPPTEFVPALRYVDKATGNIYQTFADKIDVYRFSSTTIPRVHEAFFGNKGESVIMRYLKEDNETIETFLGKIPKEYLGADGGINEVKGSFLPENITDLSVSRDTSKIFYLFNVKDAAAGITLSLNKDAKSQVFDSPYTEWLSFFANENLITLTTKPSSGVPGFMYAVNPNRKDVVKVLEKINGLTTLASPDGKNILYSDSNLSLNIFDTVTKNTTPVNLRTLPEKCTWGESDIIYCFVPKFVTASAYPDSWYQGETSFADEVWIINAKSGNNVKLLDPASVEGGGEIDGIKISLDESEKYLFFVNKKDSYLWKLDLE